MSSQTNSKATEVDTIDDSRWCGALLRHRSVKIILISAKEGSLRQTSKKRCVTMLGQRLILVTTSDICVDASIVCGSSIVNNPCINVTIHPSVSVRASTSFSFKMSVFCHTSRRPPCSVGPVEGRELTLDCRSETGQPRSRGQEQPWALAVAPFIGWAVGLVCGRSEEGKCMLVVV